MKSKKDFFKKTLKVLKDLEFILMIEIVINLSLQCIINICRTIQSKYPSV